MNNKNLTLLILLLCYFFSAFAQEDNFKRVAEEEEVGSILNQKAKKIQTITSDFIQKKHMDYLTVTIKSKGSFWFKKENYLRWEYKEPFLYKIVIKNGKIFIANEENNSEFNIKGNKIFREVNNIIVSAVKGEILTNEKYKTSVLENTEYYLIKLIPKEMDGDNIIKEMHMFFNKDNMQISKIKMVETSDNYTIITFINRKINAPIPDTIFNINQ